jgi:centromeric protein E
LLNGSGEGKSVAAGVRTSDGLLSVSSPPQSRSSSAQGSYSTSATTYDDPPEGPKATPGMAVDSGASKTEGKGNVIVSVRVRPDAGGKNDQHREWMVEGKKQLISYRGKEGGDHYYGKAITGLSPSLRRC